jgi:phospholipid-binding lipoprotein MlaA
MRLLVMVGTAALSSGSLAAQPVPSPATTATQAAPPATGDAAAADPGFLTDGLSDPAPEPRDRYEKLNRGIWGFNQTVDRILLKPVSSGYRAVVPRVARRGISHMFDNLSEPWSFVNNLLQGKPGRALDNLGRFLINTTIGIAGLSDRATKMGIPPRPEDFGQTLAVWGVKSSAYLVLPILGPSTVRDGVGTGVAYFADPYQLAINQTDLSTWTKRGIAALSVVSVRADLTESGADAFLESSLDPYASARSAFLQRRATAIANQEDDDGPEANVTDSTAASPMTAIGGPRAPTSDVAPATPAPDAKAAEPAASDPATATPATPDTTPATPAPATGDTPSAWNQPPAGAVVA